MKTLVAAAAMTLFSGLAFAGYTQPAPVTIVDNGDGTGYADGDMVSARFSADDATNIGCGTRIYDDGNGGSYSYGFCQASDSSGVYKMCYSFRQDILDQIKATGDFSFIIFRWNTDGECTEIGFSTQSLYLPEFQDKSKKK